MISKKDLRIGNYVYVNNPTWQPLLNGVALKVESIQSITPHNDFPKSNASISLVDFKERQGSYSQLNEFLDPIPLTEDILKKASFWKPEKSVLELSINNVTIKQAPNDSVWVSYYQDDECVTLKSAYVHHLQNLIFFLTSQELKINI